MQKKICILVDHNKEDLEEYLSLSDNPKSAYKVIGLISKKLNHSDDISFMVAFDNLYIVNFWSEYMNSIGLKVYYDTAEENLVISSKHHSQLTFVLAIYVALYLFYARKTIIANVIWLKNEFSQLDNNTIFMLAHFTNNKPVYSRVFPLVKPFNFKSKLKSCKKIETVFNSPEINILEMKDALNTKNKLKIKKLLKSEKS